jgi:dephospho-CoA kinase
MMKIGITGGIGSGKTAVCNIFRGLGIPVYDADTHAKILMSENHAVKLALIDYFGNEVYKNGALNKPFLAQIIFTNKAALEFVNNIVHPVVGNDFAQWSELQKNVPYIIQEAALLFESNLYKALDYIITVTCPEELRIQRVIERDKTTRENVLQRMQHQLPDNEKVRKSDFVVMNDNRESLIEQVHKIHLQIITK